LPIIENDEAAHAAASSLSRRPHQQGRHQQRHRPHTRTNPGRQYGPHPRQAACSIGVKFCAAAPTLFAPREVCASAVKTADPAPANAIARVSVTLRICFSPLVAARCPLALLETASSYSSGGFGPRRRSQEWASALKSTVRLDGTAASVMRGSQRRGRPKERSPGRGRSGALVGRSVTTILADRDCRQGTAT